MEKRWIILLVLSTAGVASFFPLVKNLADLDPYVVAFLRYAIAALALLPIVLYRSFRLPHAKEWPFIIFLACFTVTPTIFLTSGIAHTNSVTGAILMNTQPLMIGLISPLLIGEHVTFRKGIAIVLGVIGVITVVSNGRGLDVALTPSYMAGIGLLLLAASIAATNKIYSKTLVRRYDGLYTVFVTAALGSLILLMGMPFLSDVSQPWNLSGKELLVALWIGTMGTAFPWTIWSSSLKHLEVHVAASFNLLIPVFAALYAALFLNETLTLWIIVGLVLTSIGVYIVQRESATVVPHS